MIPEFEYYKRGQGELNTSNFPHIAAVRKVIIDKLTEKEFTSLIALNQFIQENRDLYNPLVNRTVVIVKGYVAHMRSDKDEFVTSSIYDLLTNLDIQCLSVQHESSKKIRTGFVSIQQIHKDLGLNEDWSNYLFIGCDKSVPKFMLSPIKCASKERVEGKVVDIGIDAKVIKTKNEIVLVDDILGGGATVLELAKAILEIRPSVKLHLWVRYNEGIHSNQIISSAFYLTHLGERI